MVCFLSKVSGIIHQKTRKDCGVSVQYGHAHTTPLESLGVASGNISSYAACVLLGIFIKDDLSSCSGFSSISCGAKLFEASPRPLKIPPGFHFLPVHARILETCSEKRAGHAGNALYPSA